MPALRDLHRDLGPPQERVGVVAVARMRRESDADAGLEDLIVDPQWQDERFVGRARETKGGLVVRHRRKDRELVTRDSRDDGGIADGLSQSRSDRRAAERRRDAGRQSCSDP